MTSIADEVYALESTIFQLKGN